MIEPCSHPRLGAFACPGQPFPPGAAPPPFRRPPLLPNPPRNALQTVFVLSWPQSVREMVASHSGVAGKVRTGPTPAALVKILGRRQMPTGRLRPGWRSPATRDRTGPERRDATGADRATIDGGHAGCRRPGASAREPVFLGLRAPCPVQRPVRSPNRSQNRPGSAALGRGECAPDVGMSTWNGDIGLELLCCSGGPSRRRLVDPHRCTGAGRGECLYFGQGPWRTRLRMVCCPFSSGEEIDVK